MVQTCKNCGAKISFDAKSNCMYCANCSSFFDVNEYDSQDIKELEEHTEDIKKEKWCVTAFSDYDDEYHCNEETGYEEDADNTMECQIYHCDSCGAEISVKGLEASTFCLYCGNPNVVYSRVEKVRRPEKIIPFKVSKEEAITRIKNRIKSAFLVESSIRKLDFDSIKGIYIPYYITDVCYRDTMLICTIQTGGQHESMLYSVRGGYCEFDTMTNDASRQLEDGSSQRLEPYDLTDLTDFNEAYLTGFYSDVLDVSEVAIQKISFDRAKELFNDAIMKSVPFGNGIIIKNNPEYKLKNKPVKAMFPAWFLTFKHNGKPYTIMVNGQTGKVIAGLPFKKNIFYTTLAALAFLLSILAIYIINQGLTNFYSKDTSLLSRQFIIPVLVCAGISYILLYTGFKKVKKALQAINRSSAQSLAKFVTKRNKEEG